MDTKQQVDATLQSFGVTLEAILIGPTMRDNWECDVWTIVIGDFQVPYYTGTGHRKPLKNAPKRDFINPHCLAAEAWDKAYLRPVAPRAADVLYSLLMDSEACTMSFNDWAGIYGYDNDSLKGFETYQACCKIGENMRQVFSRAQLSELSNLLEGY